MAHLFIYRRSVLLLATYLLTACAGDPAAESKSISGPDIVEIIQPQIDAFLNEMVDQEHFSGVALVVKNGDVLHAKGYGFASEGSLNDVNTAFHVASVTKQFTAAAIMQLVEAGTLDLTGSINSYLPEKYRTPTWSGIQVHHLLSHSSGIADYPVTRGYYDVVDGFCLGDTVDGMIREAMSKDVEFMPGTEYSYSNIGFTLLGEIIEEQTSTPYEVYMQENVFQPMGMLSSRIHVEGHVPAANEATGHRWDDESTRHVKDDVVSLPATAPDGGLVTTLSDFVRWVEIYTEGNPDVLSAASIDTMTTQHVPMGRGGEIDAYGYGLGVGKRLIGHSGYIVGFRSRFDFARENETLVAVFTNNTSNDPARISAGLLTIVISSGP